MAYSKKYKGVEKRRYTRLDKSGGFVFYKLKNRNSQEIEEALINNISVNGLCFDILEPIDPCLILECEIYQSIDCQKAMIVSIPVLAKVIWIRGTDHKGEFGSNKYKIGLKFTRISSMHKENIASYIAVKDMMKKQANSKKKQKD